MCTLLAYKKMGKSDSMTFYYINKIVYKILDVGSNIKLSHYTFCTECKMAKFTIYDYAIYIFILIIPKSNDIRQSGS